MFCGPSDRPGRPLLLHETHMRKVLLLAAVLCACAPKDASDADSTADSAAGAVAAPAPLTAADVAGTWTGETKMEGSDSVVNHWTSMRVSDTEGKLVSENSADTISYTVVYDADSMIATSKPFTAKDNPKTPVMFKSVGRLKDGKLVGTTTTMIAAKPDSVVSRARWEATRKP